MLVLADRGFDSNAFLRLWLGRRQFLVRARSTPPTTGAGGAARWVLLTRIAGLNLR
jgi:hypothetical protein